MTVPLIGWFGHVRLGIRECLTTRCFNFILVTWNQTHMDIVETSVQYPRLEELPNLTKTLLLVVHKMKHMSQIPMIPHVGSVLVVASSFFATESTNTGFFILREIIPNRWYTDASSRFALIIDYPLKEGHKKYASIYVLNSHWIPFIDEISTVDYSIS